MSQAKCLHGVARVKNHSGALICPECRKDWRARDYRKHYVRAILNQIRCRALAAKIPFDLTEADIAVPTHCPVLGIELRIGTKFDKDYSPSIDRFQPGLGYVSGNTSVISNRANRLKSDGTLEEHIKLVRWMRAKST